MFRVDLYATVPACVFGRGEPARRAAVGDQPVERPRLGPIGVIDAILDSDDKAPVKPRHSTKRIWVRLRDEHGFAGGYTTVRGYVRQVQTRRREAFFPLAHPPGHAQIDFGAAIGVIDGKRSMLHLFCMYLPQSDARFVTDYPAEPTEALLDGVASGFAFFGGVSQFGRPPFPALSRGRSIRLAWLQGLARWKRRGRLRAAPGQRSSARRPPFPT